ncbi:MAG: hypothetical protein OXC44_03715 [Proteobacteria bacterium]|nr:hypothetical protein [Pseudomonadota bacterium]
MIKKKSDHINNHKIYHSENGFAILILVSIASIILLSFNLLNNANSIALSGNKQEVIARQFFEMITAKIRSSIHKGTLEVCPGSLDLSDNFNNYVLSLIDTMPSGKSIIFEKKDDDNHFCPFSETDLDNPNNAIKKYIKNYKIDISNSGRSPTDHELSPYRIIKISGNITIKAIPGYKKDRNFKTLTKSYKIDLMSISRYGLLFWGNNPEPIKLKDGAKLIVYSDVLVTDSNKLIYYPSTPDPDSWDFNDPPVQMLGKVHTIKKKLDINNQSSFNFDIYKSIYKRGVSTGTYNTHNPNYLTKNFPNARSEKWKLNIKYFRDQNTIHHNNSSNQGMKFYGSCKEDSGLTDELNESETSKPFITEKTDSFPFHPDSIDKDQPEDYHSCNNKIGYYVYTNTNESLTIKLGKEPKLGEEPVSTSPDAFSSIFCGSITADKLIIEIDSSEYTNFALIGIFNVNSIEVRGSAKDKKIYIYNPIQNSRFGRFVKQFKENNYKYDKIIGHKYLKEYVINTSPHLLFNIFKPILRNDAYNLFSEARKIDEIYQKCYTGENIYSLPRKMLITNKQKNYSNQYKIKCPDSIDSTERPYCSPGISKELSKMYFYNGNNKPIKFRDHVGDYKQEPYYMISEYL